MSAQFPVAYTNALFGAINGQGFNMDALQVAEARRGLADLANELKKAESVGYQTPASMSPDGGNLAALSVQSIDSMVTDVTGYKESDFTFYKMLPREKATQTVHEWRSQTSRGNRYFSGRAGEGNIGVNNQSEFATGSVRIKYWIEQRALTYQAGQIQGLMGSNTTLETKNAVIEQLKRIEVDSMFASSAVDELAIDGVFTQIQAASEVASNTNPLGLKTYFDKEGGEVTFEEIASHLEQLEEPTVGGTPKVILVTQRLYTDLTNKARRQTVNMQSSAETKDFRWGQDGLYIKSPSGECKVMSVKFMDQQVFLGKGPTAAAGGDAKPATPTIAGVTSPVNASSKFLAGDAGSYIYRVMAVHNENGISACAQSSATAIAAGDSGDIEITNPGSNPPQFYRVFRSVKNGAAATCQLIGEIAYDDGGDTTFIDLNTERNNCGKMLIWNPSKEDLAWYDLLPTVKINLPMVALTQPFVVFSSGAVVVKATAKQRIINNIGLTSIGLA